MRAHFGAVPREAAAVHFGGVALEGLCGFQRLRQGSDVQVVRRGIEAGFDIGAVLHEEAQVSLAQFGEVRAAAWEAKWELPLPVVVLGGIYGGFFAVSEAAAVTALYVIVVECLVYREIPWRKLPDIMRDSMVMVGAVLLILGVSLALTNWLIEAEVPTRLFGFLQAHIDSRLMFLLLLNIFLLLLGCLLDIFSALVIMVPLLLPVAVGFGLGAQSRKV